MEQKKLYEHWNKIFLHQQYDFRSRNLNKLVLSLISKDKNVKILDIGCGTCGLTIFLKNNGYVNITSVDSSREMIEMSKRLLKKNKINHKNIYHKSINVLAKEKNKFDYIICLDVLEHIENDKQAFKNLLKILDKKGNLIISVPAIPALYGPKDTKVGHYRRYSKKMLENLINQDNLKVKLIRYWNFIGVIPTYLSLKLKTKAIDEKFRYQDNSLKNKILSTWFSIVENHIKPPIRLSLITKLSF